MGCTDQTNDCEHAGCIYIATHGKYCARHEFDDITVIRDEDLPARFQYENAYCGTDDELTARADAFKAYCAANSIFYYARPREKFFKWQAFELCAKANCTKLLMEDMS
jgi:hypothetical protein